MAFVSSRSRDRARRRHAVMLGVARVAAVFIAIGTVVYASYQGGLTLADIKLVSLRRELAQVITERDQDRAARDSAQAALRQATAQIATLNTNYAADVPQGPLATILQQARERIAEGTAPERIGEAVRNVRAIAACEGRASSRRFVIRPGTQPVADDTLAFADGLITLYATASAEDPARALTAHFTRFGGVPVSVSGPSPLRATLIVDNAELRFVVTISELRGFATATVNGCLR